MNIYKLVLDGGLVYPSIYKRLNFNSNITTASGLKSLLKRLRGSVQKDASFFISVGAEGKPDAVFVISYGFTNNAVFCKELLTAEERAAYEAEPIVLAPWDPMGALAE